MGDGEQPKKVDRYNTRYLVADLQSDRRKSIYILIGVAVVLLSLLGYFLLGSSEKPAPAPKTATPAAAPAKPAAEKKENAKEEKQEEKKEDKKEVAKEPAPK